MFSSVNPGQHSCLVRLGSQLLPAHSHLPLGPLLPSPYLLQYDEVDPGQTKLLPAWSGG